MNRDRWIFGSVFAALLAGGVMVGYSMTASSPNYAVSDEAAASAINVTGWAGGLLTALGGVGGIWKLITGSLSGAKKDPADIVMDLLSQSLARSLDPNVEAIMVRFSQHVLNNAPNSVTGPFSVSLLGSVLAERSAPEVVRTAFSAVSDFVNTKA